MEILSQLNDAVNVSALTKKRNWKVKTYLSHLADLHKKPFPLFLADMTQLVRSYPSVHMTRRKCTVEYFDKKLTLDAKAMALVMIKFIYDKSKMSMGSWNRMADHNHLAFVSAAEEDLLENLEEMCK